MAHFNPKIVETIAQHSLPMVYSSKSVDVRRSASPGVQLKSGCGGCDKVTRRATHFRFTEMKSQAPKTKIFRFSRSANQVYIYRHPVPPRVGVGRRHDEGRVAVDAEAATDARG